MKNRFHVFVMTMLLSILMGVGTASHAALLTQTFNFGMADTDWSVYNYSGTIAAVPEPSSILLLGLAAWRV